MKVNVADIKRAIQDIKKLDTDLRKLGTRATPDIVGFYGELLVWKELRSHLGWKGYQVKFGSGQSKADIVLIKNGKKIKVEVKTSRLKKEWYGVGYGFAINIKKCNQHSDKWVAHAKKEKVYGDFCYFDYMVLVTLSDDLTEAEFYILPKSFFDKHDEDIRNRSKRFSSATHRIVFIEEPLNSDDVTDFDLNFNKTKRKYKDAWHLEPVR